MTTRALIPQATRDAVFSKTGGACYYCGDFATALDHIVPHSFSRDNSERNLVAACAICNGIASDKMFTNLQAKGRYILKQRKSLRWRRKLGRMEVSVIEVETVHLARPAPRKKVVIEPLPDVVYYGPIKNPFKDVLPLPKKIAPKPRAMPPQVVYLPALPEYHKPRLKRAYQQAAQAQLEVRAYTRALRRNGITWESIRECLFIDTSVNTLQAAAFDRSISSYVIVEMHDKMVRRTERAKWLLGGVPWKTATAIIQAGNKPVTR